MTRKQWRDLVRRSESLQARIARASGSTKSVLQAEYAGVVRLIRRHGEEQPTA